MRAHAVRPYRWGTRRRAGRGAQRAPLTHGFVTLNVPFPDDVQPNGFDTLKLPEELDVDRNVPLTVIDGVPPTENENEFPLIANGVVNVIVLVPVALQLEPVVAQLSVNDVRALPETVNDNVFPCDVAPFQVPS